MDDGYSYQDVVNVARAARARGVLTGAGLLKLAETDPAGRQFWAEVAAEMDALELRSRLRIVPRITQPLE